MPRIRTIKPEFWGDEKLAPMRPIDRLVFLGLISMADDAGRLVDNVKSIDGFIFPESDESSRESLDILARAGRVIRYRSESGQKLIQIANWLKHQKVDKPAKYVLPAPDESREDLATSSRSDRRPGTDDPDLRPTTPTPSVVSSGADAGEVEISGRLENDADRNALTAVLHQVAHRQTWLDEMRASLDAMGGHVKLDPRQLGEALRDFVGNGAAMKKPTLSLFRGYLRRAGTAKPPPAPNGRPPTRTRGRQPPQQYEYTPTDDADDVKWTP